MILKVIYIFLINNIMSFENVELLFKNEVFYKINFVLNEVDLSIANALRRAMSSLLPIVTFDDTYYEQPENRFINIKKNTSSLHNEFLSHRLSLIPINMNNDSLKIITKFIKDEGVRIYEWKNEMNLKFDLQVTAAKKDNITKVTSEDFKLTNIDKEDDQSINYFKKDPFTNKFILINKLKYKVGAEDEYDTLDIECKPRIGLAKENSRYDPTGTVSFQYTIDDDNKVEEAWEKKKIYIKDQREKNSEDYRPEEYESFKKSFMLLDKERVYKSNAKGEPCSFDFGVESIGFLEPSQIVCSGLKMLELRVNDIYNCFEESEIINEKIQVEPIDENNSLKFVIKNEDHTLGTIITYILRKSNQFKFVSYRMNHPTIDEIDIIVTPKNMANNKIIIALFLEQLHNLSKELVDLRNNFVEIMKKKKEDNDNINNDNLIYFSF